MKSINIKNANIHNLKNISLEIPLNKLVVVVGPSGSGKSSLIYDLLYRASCGEKIEAKISKLPTIYAIGQKVKLPKNSKLSLGEYNLNRLKQIIKKLKNNDLLIVDEPCAGFNKNDSLYVLNLLKKQVIEGKSILVVEHSKEITSGADYIIELGPHAGKYGGELVFEGDFKQFKKSKTLTSKEIFNKKITKKRKNIKKKSITIKKINKNNFKNYTFKFPLYSLTCVSGGIGTGKSTILDYTYRSLFKGKNSWKIRLKRDSQNIIGKQHVRRTYIIDQTPIGNHPTSRISTFLNFDSHIRSLYSELPLSKKLKLNSKDFIITKEILENKKTFSKKILSVKYKKININDLLKLTVNELIELFLDSPLIQRKLLFLQEVGLGYLTLGQTSKSLSGGESQRIKLAKVLTKKLGDRCIYILDNPTKGLHLSDLPNFLKIFKKIISKNNTILIADNKEEIIVNSDFNINLD